MSFSKSIAVLSMLICSISAWPTEVPSGLWVAHMEKSFPQALCSRDSTLRLCISVTDVQCIKGVQATTRKCIAQLKDRIPASIDASKGEELGSIVGDCAEDLFAIQNANGLQKLSQCAEYKQVIEKSNAKLK